MEYIYMEYGECIYSLFGNLKFLCMSLFSRERRERAWMTSHTTVTVRLLSLLVSRSCLRIIGRAVQAEDKLGQCRQKTSLDLDCVAVGTCNL